MSKIKALNNSLSVLEKTVADAKKNAWPAKSLDHVHVLLEQYNNLKESYIKNLTDDEKTRLLNREKTLMESLAKVGSKVISTDLHRPSHIFRGISEQKASLESGLHLKSPDDVSNALEHAKRAQEAAERAQHVAQQAAREAQLAAAAIQESVKSAAKRMGR